MGSKEIRIVLADDHMLFRKGMVELINNFSNYQVIAETSNGEELYNLLKTRKELPDIAIVDLKMPVIDGYEVCSMVKNSYPDIRVLALSMYDDESSIIRMIKAGADGYILKDSHPSELKAALDKLADNGHYFADSISSVVISRIREGRESNNGIQLNEREIEFLALASTELTYREIAAKMYLSPRTIDGYRDALFGKLSVKSRVGLVLYAIKSGVVKI